MSESSRSAIEYLRSLARERMFALMRKGKMLSSSSSTSFVSIFSISASALRAAAATAADSVLFLGTVGRFGFVGHVLRLTRVCVSALKEEGQGVWGLPCWDRGSGPRESGEEEAPRRGGPR